MLDLIAGLEIITCSVCGTTFGMTEKYVTHRRNDHTMFYCPNGHSQYFPGKSETEKLRDELAKVKQARDYMEARAATSREIAAHQERRANSLRGVITKTKKRIAAGACPCCAAKFADLEKHMTKMHPTYSGKERM